MLKIVAFDSWFAIPLFITRNECCRSFFIRLVRWWYLLISKWFPLNMHAFVWDKRNGETCAICVNMNDCRWRNVRLILLVFIYYFQCFLWVDFYRFSSLLFVSTWWILVSIDWERSNVVKSFALPSAKDDVIDFTFTKMKPNTVSRNMLNFMGIKWSIINIPNDVRPIYNEIKAYTLFFI